MSRSSYERGQHTDKVKRSRKRSPSNVKTNDRDQHARPTVPPSQTLSEGLATNYPSNPMLFGGLNATNGIYNLAFNGHPMATTNQTLPPPISAAEQQHLAIQQYAYLLSRMQPGVPYGFPAPYGLPKPMPANERT